MNVAAFAARIGLRPDQAAGLVFAAIIAAVALSIARFEEQFIGQAVIEALVVALLVGVALRNVLPVAMIARLSPGTAYAGKQVLEFGVVLLGAGISFPTVLAAGPALLVLIFGSVIAVLFIGFFAGRAFGLAWKLALLVAVGNAICGNSAIAAVAPVIQAEKRDVASAIGLTALLGLLLVLGLPFLMVPLGLSHYQYGVLAGMAVYAVPQVVAAAFPVSILAGDVATTVKLTRVLLLGPTVIAASLIFRRSTGKGISGFLPWFITGFLILAIARSVGAMPEAPAAIAVLSTTRMSWPSPLPRAINSRARW